MTINRQQYEEKLNKCFVPDVSEDDVIPKKAVLGNQKVDIIIIPYGTKCVEDWAFAHCTHLKEIWLPDTIKEFGRDVFLDDKALERIIVFSKKEENPNGDKKVITFSVRRPRKSIFKRPSASTVPMGNWVVITSSLVCSGQ